MAVKSYGFAIGNLRAKETTLLKENDMLRLASAKSTDMLGEELVSLGLGGDKKNVSAIIKSETEELWKYIFDFAPDTEVLKPFLYENDFHNYKAVLKAIVSGREYADLLIEPATVDIKHIESAVKEKRFDKLPDFMRDAASESYSVLTESGDSQLSDSILDAGCMAAQLKKAEETGNKIIKELITVTVFYKNIKAALRCAKAGKNAAFLNTALTETGVVSKKAMVTAALSGEENVLQLLKTAVSVGGADAAEAYARSYSEFEKFADNRLIEAAKACRYVTIGIEPIVGYMIARLNEIKNLRIIMCGVKTAQGSEKIIERLRETYG